ncbi:MAG: hypothetical protein Q4E16_00590 [Neisseria sp.]|nr:hypothetical protein [Neisseria sp.]
MSCEKCRQHAWAEAAWAVPLTLLSLLPYFGFLPENAVWQNWGEEQRLYAVLAIISGHFLASLTLVYALKKRFFSSACRLR